MSVFLTLAYLFFIGSVFGWVLELFFRKFFSSSNPEHKWINPGFCTGPYLPIYGCGLCVLYLLASLGERWDAGSSVGGRLLLFLLMALSMTAIEYLAGLALLKWAKLRARSITSLCIRMCCWRWTGWRTTWPSPS